MKKLLFILSLSFSSVLFAQERNGITYQALIVDPSGEFLPGADNNYSPLKNTSVCLQFHIIDSTNSYEYSEQHTVTTDNFGMVNLVIGTGSAIGGVGWENVSWSASAKSLKVDVDKTGSCSSFEELSNQPLTSVPFALYSPGSDTPGPQGDPGEEGMSAYEVWLDLGNTGSEQDFIDSLKGPEGDPGDPGEEGMSAYDVWLDLGNTGTEQDFIDSLKGPEGDPGDPGTDGDSAYDVWIEAGNTGTEQEFLDSLKATDGNDGDSAYDIWIADGNTGTEQEFLDSLKGEKGDPGEDGGNSSSILNHVNTGLYTSVGGVYNYANSNLSSDGSAYVITNMTNVNEDIEIKVFNTFNQAQIGQTINLPYIPYYYRPFLNFDGTKLYLLGHAINGYYFELINGNWEGQGQFGHDSIGKGATAATISNDFSTVVVNLDVYNFGELAPYAQLSVPTSQSGSNYFYRDTSINSDGTVIAYNMGDAVRVFQKNSATWQQMGQDIDLGLYSYPSHVKLSSDGLSFVASSGFDLNQDGDVNDDGEKGAQVFKFENGNWVKIGQNIMFDKKGLFALDMDSGGQMFVIAERINSSNPVYVKVYKLLNGNWNNIRVYHNPELELLKFYSLLNLSSGILHFMYEINSNGEALTFLSDLN